MITQTCIYSSNWIDVVFEGRNKAYGAYVLRKENDSNILSGMLFSLILFLGLMIMPTVAKLFRSKEVKTEIVRSSEVILEKVKPLTPEEKEIHAIANPPIERRPSETFTRPIVRPNPSEYELPPTTDQLEGKEIGSHTHIGNSAGTDMDMPLDIPGDELEGNAVKPLLIAEVSPEYIGGDAAMLKFIQDNTVYPELAKANGIHGIVHVQFVLSPEGKAVNIKIMRGIGAGCDEEASRVIKMMPAWKPGKQNGHGVFVLMNLPFKFTLK